MEHRRFIVTARHITNAIAKNETDLQRCLTDATDSRNQVTQTIYDVEYGPINGVTLSQKNLRNRVSYTQIINNATDTYPAGATYYTYDIHGNVDTLLQDLGNSSGIANAMNQSGNRFKKIVYNYDLISGKVNQVSYQPGEADAYYHRYAYDAENRLTDVYTGRDSVMLEFFPEREAHYNYYKHGPLAQTILGQLQVQKQDYAYTLQGWLKGINPTMGGTLTNGTDTTENFPIAQDVYGFSLHYYKNDYKAIGYTPQGTSVLGGLATDAAPLFNGNIAAMSVNIPKLGTNKVYNYHYDQLNRIVAMDAYNGLNVNNGTFTPISVSDYRERVSYDPNGNILTYDRHGNAARLSMDSLKYFYTANTNRLHKVTDDATDASPGDYSKYNDIKQGQADDNYQYDEIGNLVKDNAEGITNITWNVYGKIATITKSGSLIQYVYDAAGNRIMKQTASDTTIYVRDASGNVMSVYSKPASGALVQSELHLYGSSRIGMTTLHSIPDTSEVLWGGFVSGIKRIFIRGEKLFELSNHLGNVLVTVTDRKIAISAGGSTIDYYTADISSANDYYPFGMQQPGRKFNAGNYRYGFNGQEKSPEIYAGGNSMTAEFWQYDARVGRRWNIDPIVKIHESPYATFANNPIWFADKYGGDTTKNNISEQTVSATSEKLNEVENYISHLKKEIDLSKEFIQKTKSEYLKSLTSETAFGFNPAGFVAELVFSAFLNEGKSVSDGWADMLASEINRLNDKVNELNGYLRYYENTVNDLRTTLRNSNSLTLSNGITLDKLAGAGIVAGAIHKNSKNAFGNWVLYEIKVDGEVFKYGIADADRTRKAGDWAGLPERLAQQLSKIDRLGPKLDVSYSYVPKMQVLKATVLKLESETIRNYALMNGIPIGNSKEIEKWAEEFGVSGMSKRAIKALKPILKYVK